MLVYDYSNLIEENIGKEGISSNFLETNKGLLQEINNEIKAKRQDGSFGFMELPFYRPELNEIKKMASDARKKWENIIVLGIGGSSLGAMAIHQALHHPFYNFLNAEKRNGYPRIFFMDNVDPELVQGILDVIDIKHTLFLVISKSGKTAETLSHFLFFLEKVRKQGDPIKQIIIITDPEKGPLREIARSEGFLTFSVPPNVGGRYSVLSAVGLVPVALLGIDIDALLAGAQAMAKRCEAIENPAYLFALIQFLFLQKGKNIHVMFPYAQALLGMADWWRQLWAESLGKEGNGPTPVKALGVTDQHSQLQLYMDGPRDKIITFITVKDYGNDVFIPHSFKDFPDLAYLGGHTFNELIQAEQLATEVALTKAGCPNGKFVLDNIDAFTLGEFIYCLELATVSCGLFMGINPLNQPGVELGKRYTRALMGEPNFQEEKREIETLKCIHAKV
ncbi:MAG TPA: glucose-6-phosphate isomerase [Candidatus Desulfofervidus auxilii]|uniref:Glucose-6-phosphate isomerase n=1 Tax=Desulfofervidus auxilii TaxID=1621989 RepID=A0A7C2A530_DESA2|nr:glucose-6-phosphate isomerase [Candidatus Desulfofervidus auxilii]